MRSFLIVWAGQTFSRFGTYMTAFALFNIWMWEQTGQATTIALVNVAATVASVLAAFIGGVLVDRYPRKRIMIASDCIGGVATLVYMLLFTSGNLQVWHIWFGSVFVGFFAQLHGLSLSAATSMMIPKEHYARAGGLRYLTHYGAVILSPPLAGLLYYKVGLEAIMILDILTVIGAVATVAFVDIPQPAVSPTKRNKREELMYGFQYIRKSPALMAVVANLTAFSFAYNFSAAVYVPLVLSRTDGNVLAALGSASGIGGLIGALLMTSRAPKRLIYGWLFGMIVLGCINLAFSIGRGAFAWIPLSLLAAVTLPVIWGCSQAIFMAKVAPEVQGRFFGVNQLVMLIASALAQLSAGTLADQIFEPAMKSSGTLAGLFGGIFGTSAGAGFAVLHAAGAILLIVVGIIAYQVHTIRNIEESVPDHTLQTTQIGETS